MPEIVVQLLETAVRLHLPQKIVAHGDEPPRSVRRAVQASDQFLAPWFAGEMDRPGVVLVARFPPLRRRSLQGRRVHPETTPHLGEEAALTGRVKIVVAVEDLRRQRQSRRLAAARKQIRAEIAKAPGFGAVR